MTSGMRHRDQTQFHRGVMRPGWTKQARSPNKYMGSAQGCCSLLSQLMMTIGHYQTANSVPLNQSKGSFPRPCGQCHLPPLQLQHHLLLLLAKNSLPIFLHCQIIQLSMMSEYHWLQSYTGTCSMHHNPVQTSTASSYSPQP